MSDCSLFNRLIQSHACGFETPQAVQVQRRDTSIGKDKGQHATNALLRFALQLRREESHEKDLLPTHASKEEKMHHLNLLRLSLLQCALINLAHTANKSLSTKSTTPSKPAWNQDTPIENVPSALAIGKEPYLNHEDPNIDLVVITKQLIKLLDKIKDALDDTITSTLRAVGTAPATTITSTISAVQNPALRPKGAAYGCGNAGGIYASCSSSITNFAALPAETQAGCLCNVFSSADWNGELLGCCSYAKTASGLHSYASVIASATDLCAAEYVALVTRTAGGAAAMTSTSMTSSSSISSTATPAPGPTGSTTGGSGASVLGLG
ncbi:MAG: hypothetical protein Q9228_006747, partial [Teloschistes exilis]